MTEEGNSSGHQHGTSSINNNSYRLLNAYCVPSILLSALHRLCHLITTTLYVLLLIPFCR